QELARTLGSLASRMKPAEAAQLLADALAKETNSIVRSALAQALLAVAARIEPLEVAPRSHLVTRAVVGYLLQTPHLGNAATLMQSLEPLPCRFSTQQVVDLLKMPTCVDEARSAFLELLRNRYKQPFVDLWEFVEWAEKHEPGIDFTTPPKR